MAAERRHRRVRRWAALCTAAVAGTAALTAMTAEAAPTRWKPADNGARIVGFTWVDDSTFDITVRSPSLNRQPKVRVLVPVGWRRNAPRTWPTVYAYHGGRDNYTSWTRSTEIEQVARRWRVLVVLPEAANGSFTNWYNYGRHGQPRWETFHTFEVRQLIERNFRGGPNRAAMGLSSGGQGACTYAGRFPRMFKFAACFSGVLSMRSIVSRNLLMETARGGGVQDPYRIWGDPNNPRHAANWDAHDPYMLLTKVRGTRFYVSSGTTGQPGPYDPPNLPPWHAGRVAEQLVGPTNQEFVRRARQLRVPITAHLYRKGTHSWPYWRREMKTSWPMMMRTLGARPV